MNIFVGIMCVAVAGVGIFGWWMENGKSRSDKESKKDKETDPSTDKKRIL